MSEVSLGTIYDINKNLMEKEKPLKKHEIKDKIHNLVKKYNKYDFKYFMLLCRELHDYTLFHHKDDKCLMCGPIEKDLHECLDNRGTIYAIDEAQGDAFEIWIRQNEGMFVYYFFPYDTGVIEC